MTLTLTAENTSKSASTPSGTIHYNEAGSGDVVVLLHGSGPGATGWSNFGPNIAELSRSFRVIAPDMPGWGQSDAVAYEDRDHPQALLELLDELGIEKTALVGNSMGGATSIKFASLYPERVTHLVTMGAGAAGGTLFGAADGPTEGLKALHAAYIDPSEDAYRLLVDVMTFNSDFATDELAQQRHRNAVSRRDHLENFAAGIGKPRTGTATLEQVASIAAPTLIIHGRDDRVVHFEHGLRLVSLIRNSRLVMFNRCGHWAQLEHAAEFNRLVADFINGDKDDK
jgi:2-hydroxy-6-oxonona-2,4-dienedioate hydrolase